MAADADQELSRVPVAVVAEVEPRIIADDVVEERSADDDIREAVAVQVPAVLTE